MQMRSGYHIKIGMNEGAAVLSFLESAGAAALERKRLQRRLEGLNKQRAELRTRRGTAARRIGTLIDVEREREVAATQRELESYREVEEFLDRIPDATYRTILRRRYLDVGLSWTEIQDRLAEDGVYYSQRHIIRLHTQAVEAARTLWQEEREEGDREKRR